MFVAKIRDRHLVDQMISQDSSFLLCGVLFPLLSGHDPILLLVAIICSLSKRGNCRIPAEAKQYLLLSIYCQKKHGEKVTVKRVRELRNMIKNESRQLDKYEKVFGSEIDGRREKSHLHAIT
ncbi:MAG: hypothetical protein HQL67_12315 [Magnetococcales bacterium]|nr:hypothetical protein [Magnetococcales bacterium]